MNCRTCQYELSQCLDGRLPSGRRALVMQHVDDCGDCAQFWSDLQKAQELVLRLPSQHIGSDFREQLFERIRSGEGTPEAVFREPVPLATKLRYATSGALAAAALLVVTSIWRNRDAGQSTDVAKVEEPARPGGLQPRVLRDIDAAVVPLTPSQVAVEAAQQFRDNLRAANHYARLVDNQSSGQVASPVQLRSHAAEGRELRNYAVEVQRLGSVIVDLRDSGHLTLMTPCDHKLPEILGQLDEAMRGVEAGRNGIERVARVVLQAGDLAALPQRWTPMPRPDLPREAIAEFMQRLFQGREEVFQLMFMPLPSGSDFDPTVRGSVFQLSTDCEQTFVVSRRVIQAQGMQLMLVTSDDGADSGHRVQIEVTNKKR